MSTPPQEESQPTEEEAQMTQEQPQPSEEEAEMTQSLAQDRPTMDAAVKAFISLVCARSLTASTSDAVINSHGQAPRILGIVPLDQGTAAAAAPPSASTISTAAAQLSVQQQALQFARDILKAINAYKFPIHHTVASSLSKKAGTSKEKQAELLELSIAAQLWNGLVDSKQKPSRFMGRRALRHAWKNLDVQLEVYTDDIAAQQRDQWLHEFEQLVFHVHDDASPQDDDSALLWDADGGQMELARRRERRQADATKRAEITPS
jgi:hypothetical protein